MNSPISKVALITGANVGIGKEVARQLAVGGGYAKIYMACRDQRRAIAAKNDLERATGKKVFETVLMDVSDSACVLAALKSLDRPIDVLIMNAGGMGGKNPLLRTKAGVTAIFAANVLGHVVLLEELIKAEKLRQTAIFVGSEAARGVPKLGIKRPVLPTSSADEFAAICNGSYFDSKKFDMMFAYAQVKYVGAMWMAAAARKNPDLRLLTISPGNTSGTNAPRDLPVVMRIMTKYLLMPIVARVLGIVHGVDAGAARLVDGIDDPTLKSGGFYASEATALTGPLIEQGEIFPDLSNPAFQNNARDAVHRFI